MTVKYTLEEVRINDWRWILASVSSVYPKFGHLDYVGSACKLQCTGAHAVTYFYDIHNCKESDCKRVGTPCTDSMNSTPSNQ